LPIIDPPKEHMVSFSADLEGNDDSQSTHSATIETMNNIDNSQALAALSPETQAVIAAILSNQKPKHKLDPPGPFNGSDVALYPQFEGKLQAKWDVDGVAIGDEKEQIWYAFTQLKGEAAARIFPWIDAFKGTAQFTKENLLSQLRIAFKDHATRDKAIAKLNVLRQGKRTFAELLSEFDRLLLEAGAYGWDDGAKKGYLRAAINNDLREKLITMDEADSYLDYCAQVKRVADRMDEHRRVIRSQGVSNGRYQAYNARQQAPATSARTKVETTSATQPDSMDWEPTPMRVNNVQARRAHWVNEEEREKRRKEGRCLRCGASGHLIAKCPYRAATRPAQVATVVTHEPDLEDDDDPDIVSKDEQGKE
jgi:hypothetical protein